MTNRTFDVNFYAAVLGAVFLACATPALGAANPLEQLDFANGLFSRGLYDLAISEYQHFIEQSPEDENAHKAYFGLAESYFFKEDHEPAASAYQTYISKFPQTPPVQIAWLRLGQIQFALKKYPEALELLKKVDTGTLDAGLFQTLEFYQGRCLFEMAQYDQAMQHFQKASQDGTSKEYTFQSLLFLADAMVKSQDLDAALAGYQKALEKAANDEERSWAGYKIGEIQFLKSDYRAAIESFNLFIAQFPGHELKSQAVANLMSAYFNVEDFKSVEAVFAQNFGKDDQLRFDYQTMYVLSNAYLRQFQLVKALEAINHALAIEGLQAPQLTSAYAKKVEILIKLKGYQQALDIIQKDLAPLAKGNDELLFFEAESYYGLSQYHAALSTYEKIINENPQSRFMEEAKWGRALTLKALGESSQALALLEEFSVQSTREALKEGAIYNTILLCAEMDENAKAIELIGRYLQQYPQGPHAEKVLYLKATLHAKTGDHEQAVAAYRQYISDFPEAPLIAEVRFLLAYSLQAAGKIEEALASYRSIHSAPDDKYRYSSLKNSLGIHIENNDPEQALIALKQIMEEFKDNDLSVATYIWVGQKFIDAKKYPQALQALELVPLEKASAQQKAAVAYFKAEALFGNKEHQKAVEQYDMAISMPESDDFKNAAKVGKANSLQAMALFEEAGTELENIVESNPQDEVVSLHARFHLGEIEEAQGNLDAAIKYYLLVAVLYDDQQYVPQALFRAGELLEKLQKPAEALKAYGELKERYKNNELAKSAEERIAQIHTAK
jgi:tetratricopeptide (TPR) repeat protein